MKTLALAVLGLALAVPALAADKTAAAPKGNDALQAVLTQFDTGWAKADAKSMAALCADDATMIGPEGKESKGRAAIETDMAAVLNGPMKGSQSHHTVSNVRWIGKDYAFADVDATFDNVPPMPNMPANMPPPKFHAVILFHMQGGKWMVEDARPYALMPPPPANAPASKGT